MLQKARSSPDLIRQVLDNYNREGLIATYKKVRERLDHFKELGYSSAGVVVESAVDDIKVGDRVACAGVGYASHAEIVSVPRNLVVKVPTRLGSMKQRSLPSPLSPCKGYARPMYASVSR